MGRVVLATQWTGGAQQHLAVWRRVESPVGNYKENGKDEGGERVGT